MTHQPQPLPLKVSQKARDAAADAMIHFDVSLDYRFRVGSGLRDSHPLVQAFAQFERDLTAPSGEGDVVDLDVVSLLCAIKERYQQIPSEADLERALLSAYTAGRTSSATKLAEVERERDAAEAAQLNLYRQAERDRNFRRRAEEAFDLISPWVAKFAAAVPHYAGGSPRYAGSTFNLDPEPGYRPALTVAFNGPAKGAPESPTISDLRMLADAFGIALTSLKGTPDAQ